MHDSEKAAFGELIAGVYAYHRTPISAAVINVFWNGCRHWSMEQVRHAIDTLTMDAEAGKFPPKIGDMTRVLEGTHTDRSMIAWGKVLEAIPAVGAYQDVVFDDPAIHAAVQDMGGWPKMCRTEARELGYVQTAFCKAHRAYTGRGTFDFPRLLSGDRNSDDEWTARGLPAPKPIAVGDPAQCALVLAKGGAAGKTQIAFKGIDALAVLAIPHVEPAQDANFRMIGNAS